MQRTKKLTWKTVTLAAPCAVCGGIDDCCRSNEPTLTGNPLDAEWHVCQRIKKWNAKLNLGPHGKPRFIYHRGIFNDHAFREMVQRIGSIPHCTAAVIQDGGQT